jgi:hypothetical protein
MSTWNLPGGKEGPVRKVDITAICEPTVLENAGDPTSHSTTGPHGLLKACRANIAVGMFVAEDKEPLLFRDASSTWGLVTTAAGGNERSAGVQGDRPWRDGTV